MSSDPVLQINGRSLPLPTALALAAQLTQSGQPDAARHIAEAVRALVPTHPDADYVLALAARAEGRLAEALRHCQAVLARQPAYGAAHRLLAALYQQAGTPDLALPHLAGIVETNPADHAARLCYIDALLDCGLAARARAALATPPVFEGDPVQVEVRRVRLIRLEASIAAREPVLAAARDARARGDFAAMRAPLAGWLAQHPDDAVSRALLAQALLLQNAPDEAATVLAPALATASQLPAVQVACARLALRQGAIADALRAAQRAVAALPDDLDAGLVLAAALAACNRLDEALAISRACVERAPDVWYTHAQLAAQLVRKEAFIQAAEHYRRALDLRPGYFEAMSNLGNVLRRLGRYEEAADWYRRALALKPDAAEIHVNIGNLEKDFGHHGRAVAAYGQALALNAGLPVAWSNLLFCAHYGAVLPKDEQFARAVAFGQRFTVTADRPEKWPAPGERLRVGFVSGDLHDHPVGFFLESLLPALACSERAPELYAYANQDRKSALTERIQPCFRAWRWVRQLDDAALLATIRADAIDVLIDLSGHTADNRLPVFARRAAPVQATWLGYFATTGLPDMDFIIADRRVLPPSDERWFVERPAHMPDCYLCLAPPAHDITPGPLPARTGRGLTFGSFNNLAKLGEDTIRTWCRILDAVPGSRLLLKTHQLGDAAICARVRERFAAAGLDNDSRLLLDGPSPREELLAAYKRVDIALDTFPYPGGTTTVEALWMGVPVLSLHGGDFLGRVGISILHAVGLPEWVCADTDDYVARAARLAADLPALETLRQQLRERLLASPVCDAPRFARHFVQLLHTMAGAPQRPATPFTENP